MDKETRAERNKATINEDNSNSGETRHSSQIANINSNVINSEVVLLTILLFKKYNVETLDNANTDNLTK